MSKRFKLKKIRTVQKKNILLISFLLILFLLYITLKILGNVINPIILKYSEAEVKRFATHVVTNAINDEIINVLDVDNLFTVIKNNDNDIQTIDFDPVVVNKVLKQSINAVQTKINSIDDGNIEELSLPSTFDNIYLNKMKGSIILEIPLGVVTNNAILTNLGPKIPIKLGFIGNVVGNINTKITEYGINNALLEIIVQIEVTEQIIMPLITEEIPVIIDVVLATKIIQGNIPLYYQNGLQENSSLYSVPLM